MNKLKNNHHDTQGSYSSYIIGFTLSLILTLGAYFLVSGYIDTSSSPFSQSFLIFLIVGLAITQLFVQLIFFLHLGQESKPRWNLASFLFMLVVLFIIVFGSLWIMNNLDYNMMPKEMDEYMKEQNKKGF